MAELFNAFICLIALIVSQSNIRIAQLSFLCVLSSYFLFLSLSILAVAGYYQRDRLPRTAPPFHLFIRPPLPTCLPANFTFNPLLITAQITEAYWSSLVPTDP